MELFDHIKEGSHNNCYWQKTHRSLSFEKLTTDISADVIVVGSGLAAVSVGHGLSRSGKKVVIISESELGTTGAGRTNSHLTTAVDDRYYRLERIFGSEITRIVAESYRKAIDHIERTSAELTIDCEFERLDGFLFLHPSDDQESLSKELKAAKNAGVAVTDLPFVLGTNKHVPCLKFYDQAQFHPMKYMKGLCDAITRSGGRIYTNTGISKIDRNGVITRTGHMVSANYIVVAGNSESAVRPYRTYSIAARIKKGSVRQFLWWDTGNKKESRDQRPYHHVRIQRFDKDHDVLICGGQTHSLTEEKGSDENERYVMLEAWMRERFPVTDIIYRWSGDGAEPANHIGHIGKKPGHENIYVVSGDSGNGAMTATVAGLLIPDLIDGKENPWAVAYDPSQPVPSRIKVALRGFFRSSFSFVKEKINLLSVNSKPAIYSGSGENSPEAIRQETGTDGLHNSGSISWNNDEETWDRLQQKRKLSYGQK
jgi:glycine/D-amino acid oxidase-like deaminating enzyme